MSTETARRQRMRSDGRGWFVEGLAARQAARRQRECVECHRLLGSARTPYCSRACQWRFHGRFFWDAARHVVLRRDRFTCRSCGRRGRSRELEVDHIVELARGGPSLALDNLQTLCRACHRAKTVRFLRERSGRPADLARRESADGDDAFPDWFPA
jgi:5-methylcytosine-specific restriction endonuclease McrA